MLGGLIARLRSLRNGTVRRRADAADLRDEFALHIELRTADLVRSGVPPAEAARQARAEFGGAFNHGEGVRAARGLRWFDALRFSALDFRLGARMLARYPGLTVVSSLAMGVAIAIGAAMFTVIGIVQDPHLPLDEGDRIVAIKARDAVTTHSEMRLTRDFDVWRTELRSVRDLGGYHDVNLNLAYPDGSVEPTRAAAMSASGFRVTHVPAMLGRTLVDADERPSAPPVLVLGYDMWKGRFGADSAIVGAQVRFGRDLHTIVGVMPKGYAFPVNASMWVPFAINASGVEPREGPAFIVFGRLAPSATIDQAQADIAVLGAAMARAYPQSHANLRPGVFPFATAWFNNDNPEVPLLMHIGQLSVVLLLALICVNIAILVYARTATRQREIAVRGALGASRARIVCQLFGEALVLSAVGGAIGLAIVWAIGTQVGATLPKLGVTFLPYWIHLEASASTVRYVVFLAVAGAAIIGILPALRVTRRRLQQGLQSLTGGGATLRLGGMWTALIVAQVAMTVAVLPTTVFFAGQWVRSIVLDPGFASGQVLSAVAWVDIESDPRTDSTALAAFRGRFIGSRDELLRRLQGDATVRNASFAVDIAGTEPTWYFQLDSVGSDMLPQEFGAGSAAAGYRARLGRVSPGYFAVFDAPIVAGRDFGPADADSASTAVVVNRAFVASVLGGRNAIGRRVRTTEWVSRDSVRYGPWLNVAGVVGDFPQQVDIDRPTAAVYRAAAANRLAPVALAIRTRTTDAAAFTNGLRKTAFAVDPALQLRNVLPMDDLMEQQRLPLRLIALGLVAVTMSVVILSCAGIYALMSVVVTQRRREIGIRMALGANPRRVLTGIFARAAMQLGVGVAVGIVVARMIRAYAGSSLTMLPLVAFLALAMGVVAAIVPARRALRIQPAEVMSEE